MTLLTRKSVLAIKEESTEGTPVSPTASSDYIAMQPDFSLDPAFDDLTNEELKNSIAPSKSIRGLENPTSGFSHYMRHSGVEGQAPNYRLMLKAAFGEENIQGTERDTVGGSTTSVINVDTGEGAEYPRGRALLIKDGTNGYSIRPVLSESSDALTLGFNLDNAPASGVNLGQYVNYSPLNEGHPTLSLWHYLAQGGAIQMMSGVRVTELNLSVTAAQLLNTSFGLSGVKYHYNVIEITSSDIYLDFTDDGGTFAAVISAGFYRDPHELASAIQTAMNTVQTAETHSCTYSDSTGEFTIATSTSTVLSLLWNTGTNAANTVGDKIGFSVAADDTGATTYTADDPLDFSSPQTPAYDDSDPLVAKANEIFIGDADDNVCFATTTLAFNMTLTKSDILSMCAESGKSGSIITARNIEMPFTAPLSQFDVDKFKRFANNESTSLLYNFGPKSGGNWVAGKCGSIYIPNATVSGYNITDEDGIATLNASIVPFVAGDGLGEAYLNFL